MQPRSSTMRSVVGVACLASVVHAQVQTPQTEDWTDDDTFRDTVLNSTNTYRHQHAVEPLSWSDDLASAANNWAKKCNWGHSGGPHGENLATGYATLVSALEAWGDEREEYDFSRGDFAKGTGHFTQLVWKETQRVGCARVDCGPSPKRRMRRSGRGAGHQHREKERKDVRERDEVVKAWNWYLVCEYDPAGNVLGSFPQNVLEQVNSDAFPGEAPVEDGPQGPQVPAEPEEPEDDGLGGAAENDVFTNHATSPLNSDGKKWLLGAVAVAVNLGG